MDNKVQEYKSVLQKAARKINELNARIEELKQDSEIAIIGYDCCFPGGAGNSEQYWELLKKGYDAIREIPNERFDVNEYYSEDREENGKMYTRYAAFLENDIREFDNTHFEMIGNEAAAIDPQHRLLLEVSWRAMENAGLDIPALKGSNTGVFLGLSSYEYVKNGIASRDVRNITPYSLFGTAYSAAAGRMAYFYDFKGPAIVNDSACSSSLVALNSAVASLKAGECDLAVVGAANLILEPATFIGLSRIQALAPDGRCKVFDDRADGFGRGEGCGVILLKRFNDALNDKNKVEAVIKASAVGQDGRANGFYAPNGLAEERVMKRALKLSGCSCEDIDYVEAHGTGTILGDYIEAQAIANVYQRADRPVSVGSVKSNIGHLEAAAGMAGIIKMLLSFKHSRIPPSIHYEKPNKNMNLNGIQVVTELMDWKKEGNKCAAINCFGITGTLAHVILAEYKQACEPEIQKMPVGLLTLSAQNKNALKRSMHDMKTFMEEGNERLSDICFTSNRNRSHLAYRYAMPAGKKENLCTAIDQALEKEDIFEYEIRKAENKRGKIAFLFTGQGSIYRNVGRQLYDFSSEFRQAFTMCNKIFEQELGISVFQVVYGDQFGKMEEPLYLQPVIFAVEYALTKVWDKLGVQADLVAGHSIGEIIAACYAGAISFENAVKMIVSRAKLMQSVEIDGKMVGIMTDKDTVQKAIDESGCKNVSIAAMNAPRNITISGTVAEVDKVVETLQKANRVFVNDLGILRPYHSVLMKSYEKDYAVSLENFNAVATGVKIVSGLKGRIVSSIELEQQTYWSSLLSGCVNFESSVQAAYKAGARIFIEVGGTATLTALAKQCLEKEDCIYVPTLRNNNGDAFFQVMEAVKELYLNGLQVNWDRFYETYRKQEIRIPEYPFKKKIFWNE